MNEDYQRMTLEDACAERKLKRGMSPGELQEMQRRKRAVSSIRESIEEIVRGLNARSELRPIEKISGKKK